MGQAKKKKAFIKSKLNKTKKNMMVSKYKQKTKKTNVRLETRESKCWLTKQKKILGVVWRTEIP